MTAIKKGIKADRPEPITSDIEVLLYQKRMHPQEAIDALLEGYYVLIDDFYSSGLKILSELKNLINHKESNQSYQVQHNSRLQFRQLSNRILLAVKNHRLSVKKSPEIGWFKILYPDLNEFLLPFPQVQGLNSSWQWYKKGLSIPVLDRKIHPFYGTYFPTRFEHLKLFDRWLKQYDGEKKSAIDIGMGCGVLSFQLLKHGVEKVFGTDSNPNAIIGLIEDLSKNNLHSKIELFHGDLFAGIDQSSELIVFNPPWIPAKHNTKELDIAVYYEQNLFQRFFKEAKKHLNTNGNLVLLFSNLGEITKASETHPIKAELENGGRFQKELFWQKKVKPASKKTKRNQYWRNDELVELWVLKRINSE